MSINLGVSGLQGSFSEEAGLQYLKNKKIKKASLQYLIDMENVLLTLEKGKIDLGIFPIVNLSGGLVDMAIHAMGNHLFTFVDTLWLDVHQCMLAKRGTNFNQIKYIFSHAQGLAQCKHFLKTHFKKAKLVEWEDTAKAAKDLSENQLPVKHLQHTAVIAPALSAKLYGLKILKRNIQDNKPNLTGFIIVRKHHKKRDI